MLTPVLHAARRKGLRIVAAGLTLVALDRLSLAAFQSFAEGFFAACCVASRKSCR